MKPLGANSLKLPQDSGVAYKYIYSKQQQACQASLSSAAVWEWAQALFLSLWEWARAKLPQDSRVPK